MNLLNYSKRISFMPMFIFNENSSPIFKRCINVKGFFSDPDNDWFASSVHAKNRPDRIAVFDHQNQKQKLKPHEELPWQP